MVGLYRCSQIVFFFQQYTAYEMRISDWSADVCSSDLPISHAQDNLVRNVECQTSFGTQRRPPIPLGRDHEGSDEQQPQLSDDLEDNHWRTGKRKCNAGIN